MSNHKRRVYDPEFKKEAIRLADQPGRTDRSVEKDLGLYQGSICGWRREAQQKGRNAFPGKGRLSAEEERIRNLEKKVKSLEEDKAILKKALAIFSKSQK